MGGGALGRGLFRSLMDEGEKERRWPSVLDWRNEGSLWMTWGGGGVSSCKCFLAFFEDDHTQPSTAVLKAEVGSAENAWRRGVGGKGRDGAGRGGGGCCTV